MDKNYVRIEAVLYVEIEKGQIVNYCKEHYTMPTNVAWEVIDNVLFANDETIARVGPSHRWDNVGDDEALYWEGRCLAKAEPVD